MIKNKLTTSIINEIPLGKQKILLITVFLGIKSINLLGSFILYKAFGNLQLADTIIMGVLVYTLLIILSNNYKFIKNIMRFFSGIIAIIIGIIFESYLIPVLFLVIMLFYEYIKVYSKVNKIINLKISDIGMHGILLNMVWIILGIIVFYYNFGFLSILILLVIDGVAWIISYGLKISNNKFGKSKDKVDVIRLVMGILVILLGGFAIITFLLYAVPMYVMLLGILIFLIGNIGTYSQFLNIMRKYLL